MSTRRAFMVVLTLPDSITEQQARADLHTSIGFGQPEIRQVWVLPDAPACYRSAIGIMVHGPGCAHDPGYADDEGTDQG